MNLKIWTNTVRGRAADLARAIGVSQPIMARWIAGEEIPENRARQIERATGGAVTCEEMRPDLVEEFAYMRRRPEPEAIVVTTTDPSYNGWVEAVEAAEKPELKAD